MTQEQTIKLSRIYRSCINSIEDIVGVTIDHSDEQRIIEVLQETVEKAAIVTQHCSCEVYEDCEKCR